MLLHRGNFNQEANEILHRGQHHGDVYNYDTFFLPLNSNGIDYIDPELTINSITVEPSLLYYGGDATASDWPARLGYGSTLSLEGAGSNPTLNNGSPFLGSSDDSVLFNEGKYYEGSGGVGQVTTEDFVVEMLLKKGFTSNARVVGTRDPFNIGWEVYQPSGNIVRFWIGDAGGFTVATLSNTLAAGAWYHLIAFADRSGSIAAYFNSAAGLAPTDISPRSGDITSSQELLIGAFRPGILPYDSNIAYFAMWKRDNWLDTHLQATVAANRFYRLSGLWPQLARGTSTPSVATRGSTATLDKIEGGATKLYTVGGNHLRICERLDGSGETVKGYLAEQASTNRMLQSRSHGTAPWTAEGTATVATNTAETLDPWGEQRASKITGLGAVGSDRLFQSVTGFSNNAALATGIWVKPVSGSTGSLKIISHNDAANGEWTVDLSAISGWTRLTQNNPAVTVVTPFISSAGGECGVLFYQGSGTVNIYLSNCHQEQKVDREPTSDIITTTAVATRVADSFRYVAGDNIGGEDRQQGYLEASILLPDYNTGADGYCISINDGGSANDAINIFVDATTDNIKMLTRATGGDNGSALISGEDVSDGYETDITANWKTNSIGVSVQSAEATDTDVDIADDFDRIDVGTNVSSAGQLNGLIHSIKIKKKYKGL